MQFPVRIFIAASLLFIPITAMADVVWPALFLESRLFSWWAIGVGLLAEYIFIRWLFQQSIQRSLLATVAANVVSTLAGVLLIPIAGLLWEIIPGSIYNSLLKWGTFNPVTWGATFILACLINTAIEALVYKNGFKFPFNRRAFFWIFIANAVSVGVAFVTLFISPVET